MNLLPSLEDPILDQLGILDPRGSVRAALVEMGTPFRRGSDEVFNHLVDSLGLDLQLDLHLALEMEEE